MSVLLWPAPLLLPLQLLQALLRQLLIPQVLTPPPLLQLLTLG